MRKYLKKVQDLAIGDVVFAGNSQRVCGMMERPENIIEIFFDSPVGPLGSRFHREEALSIIEDSAEEVIRERFKLRDGQIRGDLRFKNLWWRLDGQEFGYGDLSDNDLLRIMELLSPGELFEGLWESWNMDGYGCRDHCKSPGPLDVAVVISSEEIASRRISIG